MKIAAIIVRVLMGLMFVFSSAVILFKITMPQPKLEGANKIFTEGLMASIYIMPTVKIFEMICGLALISGFFTPLAVVVIFPITLNVLLYHIYLAPETLPVAIALMAANLFLAYYYRDKYKPLFSLK